MIPEQIIQQIKNISIVDVIGQYVRLKKAGASWKGLCPFHDEKTPSFNVHESKGIYKCYGCGAGGDLITFVEQKEALSFPEAVDLICERYNIEYVKDEIVDSKILLEQRAMLVTKWASEFFSKQFPGSVANEYAASRGISDEMISKFSIGYTGIGFKPLTQHLISEGVRDTELVEFSLGKPGLYDFFRNRIMFPVHNHMGKVVAFSGRILSDGMPKYVNSSDTVIYSKSKVLYGLYQAKNDIVKKDYCVVVEGAPDVISMHQHGLTNTVGTLGTSLTSDHAVLIRRYTKNVVLMYDGDKAGLKAVFRGCMVLFEKGLFVKVCQLPDGHDPDTFARSGQDMTEFVKTARDFIDFRLSLLSESITDKVVVAKEMKDMIMKFPDADARQVMLHEYGKKFGLSYKLPEPKKRDIVRSTNPEHHFVRLLLMYGRDAVQAFYGGESLEPLVDMFSDSDMRSLAGHIVKENYLTLSDIKLTGDRALFEAAERCMNLFVGTTDEKFDQTYTLLRFDVYGMESYERKLKTGQVELPDNEIRSKLEQIRAAKAITLAELNDLINQKQKQC